MCKIVIVYKRCILLTVCRFYKMIYSRSDIVIKFIQGKTFRITIMKHCNKGQPITGTMPIRISFFLYFLSSSSRKTFS